MTREQTILRVATTLALWRGFEWQKHPDARQQRRQDEFMRVAKSIVEQTEGAMMEFKWQE